MIDLLVFTAAWCSPCVGMQRAGVYTAVEAAGYPVTKIDVDQERAVADQYGITAMPTLIVRKDKVAVGRIIGARDARTLIAEMQRFA